MEINIEPLGKLLKFIGLVGMTIAVLIIGTKVLLDLGIIVR